MNPTLIPLLSAAKDCIYLLLFEEEAIHNMQTIRLTRANAVTGWPALAANGETCSAVSPFVSDSSWLFISSRNLAFVSCAQQTHELSELLRVNGIHRTFITKTPSASGMVVKPCYYIEAAKLILQSARERL